MNCSVARSLDIVGEWWTLLIVRNIMLGQHRFEAIQADGTLWLRALLPGAVSVVVRDAAGKRIVAMALRHPEGLFEVLIPRRKNRFDYRLEIVWTDGSDGVYADAYAYAFGMSASTPAARPVAIAVHGHGALGNARSCCQLPGAGWALTEGRLEKG